MARIVLVKDCKELLHPTLSAQYYDEIVMYLQDQGHEVLELSGEVLRLPQDADIYIFHGLSVRRIEELPKYQKDWVLQFHPLGGLLEQDQSPAEVLKWNYPQYHYRFDFNQETALELLLFNLDMRRESRLYYIAG